jgi:hypothetical protein
MSRRTTMQILDAYKQRLYDRQQWLHEKIAINMRAKKPVGYEQEEFYAIRWALTFILDNPKLAREHLQQDLKDRSEGKKEK